MARRQEDLATILRNLLEAYYKYIAGVLKLAKLEAKLAFRSVILITILIFIAILFALTCWVLVQVTAFCLLLSLQLSPLLSALVLLGGNLLFLAITLLSMKLLKKNLYFTATRKHLVAPLLDEDDDDEQIKIQNSAD